MPEWLREWWPLITLLVTLVIPAVIWAVRKGLVSKDELALAMKGQSDEMATLKQSMNHQLGDLDRRTIKIESDIRHLPTAAQVNDLHVLLTKVAGSTAASERQVESLSRNLNRIEDSLMKGAKP